MFRENRTKLSQQSQKRLVLYVVLVLISCSLFGCNRDKSYVSEQIKPYVSTDAGVFFDESENTVTLSHDFGVIIQPITDEVTCEFEIKNISQVTWNLKEIVNTCSCTVADMTSTKIEAGNTEKILVFYKPIGEGSFNESRKTFVLFEETEAPKLILRVSSQVREPMTIEPPVLSWTSVGENQIKRDNFKVQNFSDEIWSTLDIIEKPEWIITECKSILPQQSDHFMKQLWLVDIAANTTGMQYGEHKGEMLVQATTLDGRNVQKKVTVSFYIMSAVVAIPEHIFYGEVIVGVPKKQTVKFHFVRNSIPPLIDMIHFNHSLGKQLELKWLSTEGIYWELETILTLNDEEHFTEKESLVVSFDTDLPTINIPLFYSVVHSND